MIYLKYIYGPFANKWLIALRNWRVHGSPEKSPWSRSWQGQTIPLQKGLFRVNVRDSPRKRWGFVLDFFIYALVFSIASGPDMSILSLPVGWSETLPDTPVDEMPPGPEVPEKIKKRYRKKKTKLEEAFPTYLQVCLIWYKKGLNNIVGVVYLIITEFIFAAILWDF